MAIPRQEDLHLINRNLGDDVTDYPPPIPPRTRFANYEKISELQHQNEIKIRLPETVNLMTFPDDDGDTNSRAASSNVCTGNALDNIFPECTLLTINDNLETDDIHHGIQTNVDTNSFERLDNDFIDHMINVSDNPETEDVHHERHSEMAPHDFETLDKDSIDDIFNQSPDVDSETMPWLYTPSLGTHHSGIDAVQSPNGVDLPAMQGKNLQNQSDKSEMMDLKESATNLTNVPSLSSKSNAMEDHSDSADSKRSRNSLNRYFRENSIYVLDEFNQHNSVESIHESGADPEEQDDLIDVLKPSQQDVYLKKLRELEEEVNKLQLLQNKGHPWLSTQRSLSESDIYSSREESQDVTNEWCVLESDNTEGNLSASTDNLNRNTRDRSSKIKHDQLHTRTSRSSENIKTKATNLWRRITNNHCRETSDGTPQKFSIKVETQVELSCPCERSCTHVKRLVAAQGGYMWLSFNQCPWVSLYNNKHEIVHKFKTRGSVDSLAVSSTGVLFVSCPTQQRILMFSSNLQMTVLRSFRKLYPRGVAVSPADGTLVVCMVPQAVGNVMEGPSNDSCLMRFKGKTPNETGTIVNKENYFGYPVSVTINVHGYLLVSDFGLRCLFVLDTGGNMLRTFSTVGAVPLWLVHALTSNVVNSFYVIQGGGGALSITRLGECQGTFEEKWTSTKKEPSAKSKIETSSMNMTGQIVLASGNVITHVSLVYSY